VVRQIFDRYLELGSVHRLRDELEAEGVRSKSWVTAKGRRLGGQFFGRGALFHLLKNPTYIGAVPHKGTAHPGLHAGIVDPAIFEAVQRRLAENAAERTGRAWAANPASLKGRLFDAAGEPMSPTRAFGRGGRSYRYYSSSPLQRGAGSGRDDVVRRVPAAPLEALVDDRLRLLTGSSRLEVLDRVELKSDGVELVLDVDELGGRAAFERTCARLDAADEVSLEPGAGHARLRIAMRPVFRGGRTWLVGPSGAGVVRQRPSDSPLAKALRAAHAQQRDLEASPLTPTSELAHARAPIDTYYRRRAQLVFLAPDLQRAILAGDIGVEIDVARFVDAGIPLAWPDQRRLFRR